MYLLTRLIMKKTFILLFCMPLVWQACSSDASSNSSNAEGNVVFKGESSNSIENEEVLLSSSATNTVLPPYGIIPIDTAFLSGGPQNQNAGDANVTSSSKTEYYFFSERTVLYEDVKSNRYTNVYYEDLGVQHVSSDYNGGYLVTFRTLSDESRKYAGWLWSNSYSQSNGACENDYALFERKCFSHNGEFVNYKEGDICAVRQLWLSCVYPLEIEVNKAFIDSVATEIHSFAIEHWSAPYPEKEPSSSKSASSTSP